MSNENHHNNTFMLLLHTHFAGSRSNKNEYRASNTMNIGRVTKKNRSKKSTKKANKKEENKTMSKRYSKCNNKNLYIFPHKVKSMLK